MLPVETGTDWTEARGDVLRQNDYVSLQIEELRAFIHHPLIAASAARLARTRQIRLFHDQLIYKPPQASQSDTGVGWHTDIAYWKTCSSRNLITAWIPFQPVQPDMGPMMVMDGSHRWPGNDRLEKFHVSDLASAASHVCFPGTSHHEVPLLLDLGQVSFHHCRTIHGSPPNDSSQVRLALAVHMQDEANQYLRVVDEVGNPASHINDLLCRKQECGDPDYSDPEIFPVLWKARTDG